MGIHRGRWGDLILEILFWLYLILEILFYIFSEQEAKLSAESEEGKEYSKF